MTLLSGLGSSVEYQPTLTTLKIRFRQVVLAHPTSVETLLACCGLSPGHYYAVANVFCEAISMLLCGC